VIEKVRRRRTFSFSLLVVKENKGYIARGTWIRSRPMRAIVSCICFAALISSAAAQNDHNDFADKIRAYYRWADEVVVGGTLDHTEMRVEVTPQWNQHAPNVYRQATIFFAPCKYFADEIMDMPEIEVTIKTEDTPNGEKVMTTGSFPGNYCSNVDEIIESIFIETPE
jgi:hypothetical protein